MEIPPRRGSTCRNLRHPDSLGNRKSPLSTKSAAFEISTTSREAPPNAVETRSEFRDTSRAATRCSRPTLLGRRRWSSLRSHPPHGNRVPWLHKISASSSPSPTDRPCSSNGRGFVGKMGINRFPRDGQGDGERSGCLNLCQVPPDWRGLTDQANLEWQLSRLPVARKSTCQVFGEASGDRCWPSLGCSLRKALAATWVFRGPPHRWHRGNLWKKIGQFSMRRLPGHALIS